MELRIKLEAYEDRLDYSLLSETECRINIDENRIYAAETLVVSILRHLYDIIAGNMNDAGKQTEK